MTTEKCQSVCLLVYDIIFFSPKNRPWGIKTDIQTEKKDNRQTNRQLTEILKWENGQRASQVWQWRIQKVRELTLLQRHGKKSLESFSFSNDRSKIKLCIELDNIWKLYLWKYAQKMLPFFWFLDTWHQKHIFITLLFCLASLIRSI